MLSVLVPTYHYNVLPLAKTVVGQLSKTNIPFEFICIDDGSSSELNIENRQINFLPNATFSENKQNLGRSCMMNLLASHAKYPYLLFLDADVVPVDDDFINKYLHEIKKGTEVCYGGLAYKKEHTKEQALRWRYGMAREAITLKKRLNSPYAHTLTSNLLIKKEVVLRFQFPAEVMQYGYEDTVFVNRLKVANIPIVHLQNPVYHLQLDTTAVFLKKTFMAVENLVQLSKNNQLAYHETRLGEAFTILRKSRMVSPASYFLNYVKYLIIKQLYSKKPSLILFDLYKLGLFCKLHGQ